jgi:aspartyl/asparaginyl beta-hydroxylase (cupin superfamily)
MPDSSAKTLSDNRLAYAPAAPRASSAKRVFYYVTRGWYQGDSPVFFDPALLPGTKILEDNWQIIKDEIEAYYAEHADAFQPNFTPYAYKETGWKTINLYSYFLKYNHNCEKLPRTNEIVSRIRGMSMCQIAVLDPHTRIKAHFGDTDAIIRSHLGIRIPGKLPELGLRVRRQRVTWEEGKVFAFCIAHRHYAWNYTDEPRIALVLDTFKEQYMARRYAIAGNALAAIVTKAIATRFPRTKEVPGPLVVALHRALGLGFRLALFLQRHFDFPADGLLGAKKID